MQFTSTRSLISSEKVSRCIGLCIVCHHSQYCARNCKPLSQPLQILNPCGTHCPNSYKYHCKNLCPPSHHKRMGGHQTHPRSSWYNRHMKKSSYSSSQLVWLLPLLISTVLSFSWRILVIFLVVWWCHLLPLLTRCVWLFFEGVGDELGLGIPHTALVVSNGCCDIGQALRRVDDREQLSTTTNNLRERNMCWFVWCPERERPLQ